MNSLGRRNLIPAERARLALQLEPLIAARAKEKEHERKTTPQISAESLASIDTREELAKIAGVSHDTIHKMKVIESEAPEEVKERVRSARF